MSIYYENVNEYIDNFNINAPIVDTEERNKMCELWEDLAYSKIYLVSLCEDDGDKKLYSWYKEEVYWTGWEWNEENNHIHGIGTMRNVNSEDEQQKSHMMFDRNFGLIISEKRLKEMYNRLKTEKLEKIEEKDYDFHDLNKMYKDHDLCNCINHMINFRNWEDEMMKYAYCLNERSIPGKLDIHFPKIG